MIKLNKEEIREIALNRFHDKFHESIYDVWTDALEAWLGKNGYKIVSVRDWAKIEARRIMEESKILDADGEATVDAKVESEDSKN